jgi:hypothetical protein
VARIPPARVYIFLIQRTSLSLSFGRFFFMLVRWLSSYLKPRAPDVAREIERDFRDHRRGGFALARL